MDRTRLEILTTELDDYGAGVGIAGELRLHVPGLLPGERGVCQLEHQSPHRAQGWGTLLRLVGSPSPDRVAPACPAFGECGGCAWQHLSYAAQLRFKRQRVVTAMAQHASTADLHIAEVIAAPTTLGYRNKGKYVVGGQAQSIVMGAYRPRSHDVVATTGCRVVAPVIDELAEWVRGAADAVAIEPYVEQHRKGELRYVVIRRNSDDDALIALVVASTCSRTKLQRMTATLSKHPAVRTVVAINNDRHDGAIVPSGASVTVLLGDGVLLESIAGAPLYIGAVEFMQVNLAAAEVMYRFVADCGARDAPPSWTAVDLYAGLGGISAALAQRGANVTAIEVEQAAVNALSKASKAAGYAIDALAGAAATVAGLGWRPDVVVVNPPRKGLDAATRNAVCAVRPSKLIYVSCGPQSLAHDVVHLISHGYRVALMQPFDLMPHTSQIETVVVLEL
jgi:23S rRNA (uracil1939-C5)-methyltransferase